MDATNLVEGQGTLYLGPVAEPLPELDDIDPGGFVIATPAGNWSPIGFTIEEHAFEYEVEMVEDRVNERNVAIDMGIISEAGLFKVKFKERDLTALNLAIAASTLSTVTAAADQTGQDLLKLGDGALVKKALLYVHTSPEGGSRVLHLPNCIATGGLALQMDKGKTAPFDVEFKVLSDETESAGARLGTIYDLTAAATT